MSKELTLQVGKLIGTVLICFLISYFFVLLSVGFKIYDDNKKVSDVVIVLGARSYLGGNYNPCLVARVNHGADILKMGYSKKMLMSGGVDDEDKANEAQTMKKIAIEQGIRGEDVILETKSDSTYENLMFSKHLMDKHKLRSAIIVSEPFHLPRAALIAQKLGIKYSVSPATTSQCWLRWKFLSRFFLKEPLAVMWYHVLGRL